jgi:hypothetical protein
MIMDNHWRSADLETRRDYLLWLQRFNRQRQVVGIKNYGKESFHGDPITHGLEEVADAFFYLYWAKRRHIAFTNIMEDILALHRKGKLKLPKDIYSKVVDLLDG